MEYTRHKSPAQELGRVVEQEMLKTLMYGKRYCPKPGQAYNKLPEETKETLSKLKSEDLQDPIILERYYANSDSTTRMLRR